MASGLAKFMGGAASAGLDAYKTSRMAELQEQRDNRLQAFKNKSRQEDMWMAKKKMESDSEWRTQQSEYQENERVAQAKFRTDRLAAETAENTASAAARERTQKFQADIQKLTQETARLRNDEIEGDIADKKLFRELLAKARAEPDLARRTEMMDEFFEATGKTKRSIVKTKDEDTSKETMSHILNGRVVAYTVTNDKGVPVTTPVKKLGEIHGKNFVNTDAIIIAYNQGTFGKAGTDEAVAWAKRTIREMETFQESAAPGEIPTAAPETEQDTPGQNSTASPEEASSDRTGDGQKSYDDIVTQEENAKQAQSAGHTTPAQLEKSLAGSKADRQARISQLESALARRKSIGLPTEDLDRELAQLQAGAGSSVGLIAQMDNSANTLSLF
tara:strand:+ start:1379 stop:2542 length:1164 start_codon:yes stop_codon:yes gene_type:complete